MNGISVVIPTYNEKGTIGDLIKRIVAPLEKEEISYELIFIDDNSTDGTQQEILKHDRKKPVIFELKKGEQGKAYSLLQGFKLAKYDAIAMIDADLQYPPEVIPSMYEKLDQFDIVVAERRIRKTSFLRSLLSHGFIRFFGKTLHHLETDVQSGLKIFKKEIFEKVELNPTPWTFDLEFLVRSREQGYKITGHPITFEERKYGKSKVSIFKTIFEIGISAVKLKFSNQAIVTQSSGLNKLNSHQFFHKGNKYVTFNQFRHGESAFSSINARQKNILIMIAVLFLVGLVIDWHLTIILGIAFLTIVYLADIVFYLYLTIKSLATTPEILFKPEELQSIPENELPTYTILCPLYKEWHVLPQFVKAINDLDYPKEKLQVLLLLEEDDEESINRINSMNLPFYFQKLVVPHSMPKTKPKACNYGLHYATGKYSVIFDAEDIPEKEQLRKAVVAFNKLPGSTICLQAKLNFYNPKQNLLTHLFTSEYSLWFDLILPGLQSVNAPIPLGGTSNHFRTADLRSMNGWDAFNVTEDADLGVRLASRGLKTAIIDSTTYEEANSLTRNWLGQRSRWIKGYIQTFLVHTRKKNSNRGIKDSLLFQFVIGGKIFLLFINPVMWIIILLYFGLRPISGPFIESFFPTPVLYMGVASLLIGNFVYLYSYMIGCAKREKYELIKYAYLVPIYWLMMSLAAWVALYQLIRQPHYWFKTLHGLHLTPENKSALAS